MTKYLILAYAVLFSLALTGADFEPKVITSFPVLGYREIPFQDDFHATERLLLVWYPVEATVTGTKSDNLWDVFNVAINAPISPNKDKYPVIVLSHGYLGNPHQLSWLIRGLVHAGFIVLSIQHRDLELGKVHVNHWLRAMDVSMILSQFAKNAWSTAADLSKIGVSGFSLGGTTALLVIGGRATKLNTLTPSADLASPRDFVKADEALPSLNKEMMSKDWKDARIKAAFIMAPGWTWLFDEESLKRIQVPVYLIAGGADDVLITKNTAGYVAKYIPKVFYQVISGEARHYIFVSLLKKTKQGKVSKDGQLDFLFVDDKSIDRAWIQNQVIEEAIRFFYWSLKIS